MKTAIQAICFTLLFSAFSFRAAAEDFTNALHAYLQQCVHAEIPNGCIVIGIVDEHGSRVVGCGNLDNGTEQVANGDTVFSIHSMTGAFTRLLLQDMVERGEMKLDDPAAKYLPKSVKMPTHNGKEITLRHLAQETSGLPNGFPDNVNPKRADNPLADYTIEKMFAFVSGCQLTNDPGTTHAHGGVGMGLLGQAMALKAGTNYESLMVDRIFGPLQMDSTRFTLTPKLKSRFASEHNQFGDTYTIPDWGYMKYLAGLYLTANDLLKFMSAFSLTPTGLTPLMEKSMVNFGSLPQLQGWGINTNTGGGWVGGSAYAYFDRTRRRGVVVLATSYALKHILGNFLLESEWQSERRPKETNINRKVYGSYVGQYQRSPDQPGIGIRREGDRLFAQATDSKAWPVDVLLPPIAAELLPESETRFFERLSGNPVTFSRNFLGKVTGLTMDYQGKAFSYKKISDQPPKAPEPVKPRVAIKLDTKLLDACVGHYEFAPDAVFSAGMKLKIWREGDQLVSQAWCEGENVLPGAFDIYPESETIFFDKLLCAQYIFVKNDKGEVTAVIHHLAGFPDSEGKKLKKE